MDDEPDEVLVARYQDSKDESAFKALLDRHYVKVHQLVSSILGARFGSEVDGVVQEIFMRAHRGLIDFRRESKFGTWLYRIAFNQASSFKSRSYKGRVRTDCDWESVDLATEDLGPSASLERSQLKEILDTAIDRLPVEYQIAVRLHYWFHVSIRDISLQTSTRENTVKSYLHRARKLLEADLRNQRENL